MHRTETEAMTIFLRVDNFDVMPDGGPNYYHADRQGFVIGRDPRLDWSLQDPNRHISGRHCEVRFENDCYALYDVSTNGTYVNGSGDRVGSPYILKDGDRLTIGQYVISVRIAGLDPAPVTERPAGFAGLGGESEPFAPQAPQSGIKPTPGPDAPSPVLPTVPKSPASPPAPGAAVKGPLAGAIAGAGPAQATGLDGFIELFARGARIDPADLDHLDPSELAEEVGAVMRIVVEHLAVLLAARAKAKMITKSANRTMLAADDNNPLKFLRTPDEMLTALFARSRRGFKDAGGSVSEAFADLEKHEFATIFAMQKALGKLLEDISPEAIESDVAKSVFSSRQARAWDLFVERWQAKNEPHENGVLDAFLEHFAEYYDQRNES